MKPMTKFKLGNFGIAHGGYLDGAEVYYNSRTDVCWVVNGEEKYDKDFKTYSVKMGDYCPVFTASKYCDYIE